MLGSCGNQKTTKTTGFRGFQKRMALILSHRQVGSILTPTYKTRSMSECVYSKDTVLHLCFTDVD